MADLDPTTPPELFGSSRQLSEGYDDEDGMDINALHAQLDDELMYDNDVEFESHHHVNHEAGGMGLHDDIDGVGGWADDDVLGGEVEEGVDINQEALLMDEDLDPEMQSDFESRPVSRLESHLAESWRDEQQEAVAQEDQMNEGADMMAAAQTKELSTGARGDGIENDTVAYSTDEFHGNDMEEEEGGMGGGMGVHGKQQLEGGQGTREMEEGDGGARVEELYHDQQQGAECHGVEMTGEDGGGVGGEVVHGHQQREGGQQSPSSLPVPPIAEQQQLDRQGSARGILSLPVGRNPIADDVVESPSGTGAAEAESGAHEGGEGQVDVAGVEGAEVVGGIGGEDAVGEDGHSPQGYLGEVFSLDRLAAPLQSRKPAVPTDLPPPVAPEKPSKLRKPSTTPPATDIDSLLARLEHSQAPPPHSTKAKEGGAGKQKAPRVADEIKGTVDAMEREAKAQRQHAAAAEVRARRRGGAGDPHRRSKSAMRERPGSDSDGGDTPSRRRARSSDPPVTEKKAKEKGWTFKSSPPVKKVPASKIEVSKPSPEEIRQRRRWAAEKVRLQKEQEEKEAARAKRAEAKRRAEKEAREWEIKERLQARAQARVAHKEQLQATQAAKSPGTQRAGKVKPLYKRLEEQAARRAAREEAEKLDKYNRELGAARRRKTTAIIKEAQQFDSTGDPMGKGEDMTLVLPEIGQAPSHKSSPKYFSSHDTPASMHSPEWEQTVSKSRIRFPKVKGAEEATPSAPPLPPVHPDSDLHAMMSQVSADQGGVMAVEGEYCPPPGEGVLEGYGIPPGPMMLMKTDGEAQEELPFNIVPYGAPEPLPSIVESPSASSQHPSSLHGAAGSCLSPAGGMPPLKDAATSVSASFEGIKRKGGAFQPRLTDVLAFNIMISAPQRVKPVRLLDETLTLEELAASMPAHEQFDAPMVSGRRTKSRSSFESRLSQEDRQRVFVGDKRTPAEVMADASSKLNPQPPSSPEQSVPQELQACHKRLSGLAAVDLEVGSFTRGRGMEMVREAVDDGLWGSPAAARKRHSGRGSGSPGSSTAGLTGDGAMGGGEVKVDESSSLVSRQLKLSTPEEAHAGGHLSDRAGAVSPAGHSGEVSVAAETQDEAGHAASVEGEDKGDVNRVARMDAEVGEREEDSGVPSVTADSTNSGSKPTSRESSRSRLERLKRRGSQSSSSRGSRRVSAVGDPVAHTSDAAAVVASSAHDAIGQQDRNSSSLGGVADKSGNAMSVVDAGGGCDATTMLNKVVDRDEASEEGKAANGEEIIAQNASAETSEPKRGLERLRSQKEQRRGSSTGSDGGTKTLTGLAALRRLSSSRRSSMTNQRAPSEIETSSQATGNGQELSGEGSRGNLTAGEPVEQQSRRLSSVGSKQPSLNRRGSDASAQHREQRQASSSSAARRTSSGASRTAASTSSQHEPPVGTLARKISRISSQRRNSTGGTASASNQAKSTAATSSGKRSTVRNTSRQSSKQQREGGDAGAVKHPQRSQSVGGGSSGTVTAGAASQPPSGSSATTMTEEGNGGEAVLPDADGIFEGKGDSASHVTIGGSCKSELEDEVPLEAIDEESPELMMEDASASVGSPLATRGASHDVRMSKALSSAEFPVMPPVGEDDTSDGQGLQPLHMPATRQVSARGACLPGEDGDGVLMASPLYNGSSPAEPQVDAQQRERRISGLQPRNDGSSTKGGSENGGSDGANMSVGGTQEVGRAGDVRPEDIDDDVFGGADPLDAAPPQNDDNYPGSSVAVSSEVDFGSIEGPDDAASGGDGVGNERVDSRKSLTGADGAEGGEEDGYSDEFDDYDDDFEDA